MNTRNHFEQVFSLYAPIAITIFAVIVGLLLFAALHYRAGRGHEASKKSEFKILEPLVGVMLIGFATFLAVTVAHVNATERKPLGKPQLTVTITGFQWCWSFHYHHTPVTVTSSCVHSVPTLVVPTNEVIRFSLTSKDVVHEWWLPYARWKEEAFPGHYNIFELRFTATGEWTGRCDEFCGLYHDRMIFKVKAESPAKFTSWLKTETKAAR